MTMRRCTVAGTFYPSEPAHLEQLLHAYFSGRSYEGEALGLVSPHAGIIYSGETSAYAYSSISPEFDGTFVVIGPSHQGFQTCTSAMSWETPLGIIDADEDLVDMLDLPVDDYSMTQPENSLEVQMPFIKFRFPGARIAPILMGDQRLSSARLVAEKILRARRGASCDIRIVASSDFSHYVPESRARTDDRYAIEALKDLDVEEFYSRLWERDVTACGYGPIAAMCIACRESGAHRAELLHYTTSGEVTGDFEQVVGYAAIAVM
ncbi:MAG: AmmeMemoRadiSam system protein B [Methanoculleaceae archaeon]